MALRNLSPDETDYVHQIALHFEIQSLLREQDALDMELDPHPLKKAVLDVELKALFKERKKLRRKLYDEQAKSVSSKKAK